jgi:hypothetical protein
MDALVMLQIFRRRRRAVALDVGRRGNGQDTRFHQLARHQRGWLGFAETQGQVEALGHQVAQVVADDHFHLQFGIGPQEGAEARPQHMPRDIGIDVHPQAPAHAGGALRGIADAFLQFRHQRQHLAVETVAFVGQLQRARGALEQAYAQPRLEARYGAADAGRRHVQHFAGSGKAARVHDGGQYLDSPEHSLFHRLILIHARES